MAVIIQRKFQEISEYRLSGEIPEEYDFGMQNPAFSAEDSKVSVATCTATTQMASIFRICGTAGSSPAIFMSKEGTKPRQVESADLSTG